MNEIWYCNTCRKGFENDEAKFLVDNETNGVYDVVCPDCGESLIEGTKCRYCGEIIHAGKSVCDDCIQDVIADAVSEGDLGEKKLNDFFDSFLDVHDINEILTEWFKEHPEEVVDAAIEYIENKK